MNKLMKSCAIALVTLSASTGLVSCDKNQLVEPTVPTAKPVEDGSSVANANSPTPKQYLLKKINMSYSSGYTDDVIFQYPREGDKVGVVYRGSYQRYEFKYTNNTITSTFYIKNDEGPASVFRKEKVWTYTLDGNGRCYESKSLTFGTDGEPSIMEPVFTYHYNKAGKLATIKENGNDRAIFTYNADGDLIKEVVNGVNETTYSYDAVGPNAGNLQSTDPHGQPLTGLIADQLNLNPWNLTCISEYLPIFGKFRSHLPRRYQTRNIPTNKIWADWSSGYVVNGDNQVIEHTTIITNQGGSTIKEIYNYDLNQPVSNKQ